MRTGSASAPEASAESRQEALDVRIRLALPADLAEANAVIERAVMTWRLPERVKRLALPSYRYHSQDLAHLQMLVAETAAGRLVGVATLEEANPKDLPAKRTGLLLHGLYVDPDQQRQGVGRRLLEAALVATHARGFDGLLVKAQPDAVGFFRALGMVRLQVTDPDRDYPHRYWLAAHTPAAAAQNA